MTKIDNLKEIKEGDYFYIAHNLFYDLYQLKDKQIKYISHYWTLKELKNYIKGDK